MDPSESESENTNDGERLETETESSHDADGSNPIEENGAGRNDFEPVTRNELEESEETRSVLRSSWARKPSGSLTERIFINWAQCRARCYSYQGRSEIEQGGYYGPSASF